MSIALGDIATCFEGVYPSAIATRGSDGMPNISYLSHVAQVDDRHIAISNQFFAKTAANIRTDPRATLLMVEPRSGRQYHLALSWRDSVDRGPLFTHIEAQLQASSAQIGLSDVMRLRAVDVFRVEAITQLTSDQAGVAGGSAANEPGLVELVQPMRRIADLTDSARALTELLDIVRSLLGHQHAMVLLSDETRKTLAIAASIGYRPAGVGAEVGHGVGLIGGAAATGRLLRTNEVSRVRRLGSAVIGLSPQEAVPGRQVALPELTDALSQIAVPMIIQRQLCGVLFVESNERLAFDNQASAALQLLAQQTAATLALNERSDDDEGPLPARQPSITMHDDDRTIRIVHHRFDHSVFINQLYVIKGIAGRLLMHMLHHHRADGQRDFTNRELRLAMNGALPELKDNLETRLLLLRRRLDELQLQIRLHHTGRGRLHLDVHGRTELREEE